MKGFVLHVAALATIAFSACSGGGTSSAPGVSATLTTPALPSTGTTGGATMSSAQQTATVFSVAIPLAAGGNAQSVRSRQYVSPATNFIYISLEDTPGHGNATFSYTEKVDSTHCTVLGTMETCMYTVQMPIGNDLFSILTASADNVPLGYATSSSTISAGGSNATPGGQAQLSPIIASATAQYAFQKLTDIPFSSPLKPVVTPTAFDAAGDIIALNVTGNAPFGDTISTVSVNQSVGQFTADTDESGRLAFTSAPENAVTLSGSGGYTYLVEVGNGTTAAFTTTLTLTTPQVQYTQTEFPQLPTAALTVPASSSSLTLTCQFASATPTTDPCPGTASASFGIF